MKSERKTVMCIRTHIRTKNHSSSLPNTKFLFECGAFYELQDMNIIVPYENREERFPVSSLFLENNFASLAKWRELQIKSVLDD
jgi:hypothetical protein